MARQRHGNLPASASNFWIETKRNLGNQDEPFGNGPAYATIRLQQINGIRYKLEKAHNELATKPALAVGDRVIVPSFVFEQEVNAYAEAVVRSVGAAVIKVEAKERGYRTDPPKAWIEPWLVVEVLKPTTQPAFPAPTPEA